MGPNLDGAAGRASAEQRPFASRLLHNLGLLSASSAASISAAVLSSGFLLGALLARRTGPWLNSFSALASAVTLVMVFALQHTQYRQQAAVQRKLDEILRALPGADNRLVHVETASEHELAALADQNSEVRQDALTRPD